MPAEIFQNLIILHFYKNWAQSFIIEVILLKMYMDILLLADLLQLLKFEYFFNLYMVHALA